MKRARLGLVSVSGLLASFGVAATVAPAFAAGPGEMRVTTGDKAATAVQVSAVAAPAPASQKGAVTDVQITGFKTPDATGQVTIQGRGTCRLRVATYRAPYERNRTVPVEAQLFDAPVTLPITIPMKRPAAVGGGDHVLEVMLTGVDEKGAPTEAMKKAYPAYEGCSVVRPPTIAATDARILRKVYATYAPGTPAANQPASPGAPAAGGAAGGGAAGGLSLPGAQAATGKITSLQVPGGSFAADEAQKLQVFGAGGCGFDLSIKKVDAAGGFDKTFDVNPVGLDKTATLYNGTHFDTLAEGSYSAKVVGKNGCTGSATIDFKVTPKSSTKLVKGQPVLSLEKAPIAGPAFRRTKDSNINFVVKLPMDVKDEPYVGCCEVEYNFKNAYGGWEVYGVSSPIQDGSFGGAFTQPQAVVFKSVSGFKEGTEWRMRVRAYKYKTQFEWSEWLHFQVDQN